VKPKSPELIGLAGVRALAPAPVWFQRSFLHRKVTKKYVDREELLYCFIYVALAARKGDVPG
jgi:hypothetical protein